MRELVEDEGRVDVFHVEVPSILQGDDVLASHIDDLLLQLRIEGVEALEVYVFGGLRALLCGLEIELLQGLVAGRGELVIHGVG